MRPIKYRAWDKESQEMVCWEIILDDGFEKYINDLIQFTGLYDKNGTEIYEGDLMSHPDFTKNAFLPIEIKDGYTTIAGWDCLRTDISKGKVIGNIYENPELLK